MPGWPGVLSTPIDVYAGDSCEMVDLTVKEAGAAVSLTSWTDWAAVWRPADHSPHEVLLTVDTTQLEDGRVIISADASATRRMQTLTRHSADGLGRWDLQAKRDGTVRTFLRGRTRNVEDQTK